MHETVAATLNLDVDSVRAALVATPNPAEAAMDVGDPAADGAAPPRRSVEPAVVAAALLHQPPPSAVPERPAGGGAVGRGEDVDARRAKIRAAQLAAAQQRQQAQ